MEQLIELGYALSPAPLRRHRAQLEAWAANKRILADGTSAPSATKPDGRKFEPLWWIPRRITCAASPQAMAEALRDLAANPRELLIQGAYKGTGRVCRTLGTVWVDRKVDHLPLDVDEVQAPDHIDPTTDAAVRWYIETHLPTEFHNAGYAGGFSSRAGMAGQALKVHLFFLLASPERLTALNHWAKVTQPHGVDPRPMLATQKVYTAAPTFDDPSLDPFAGRDRIFYHDGPPLDYDFSTPEETHEVQRGETTAAGILRDGDWRTLAEAGVSVHSAAQKFAKEWTQENGGIGDPSAAVTVLREALLVGRATALADGRKPRPMPDIERELTALPADLKACVSKGLHLKILPGRPKDIAGILRAGGPQAASAALTLALRDPENSGAVLSLLDPVPRGAVQARLDRFLAAKDQFLAEVQEFTGETIRKVAEMPLRGCVALRAPYGIGKTEVTLRRLREAGKTVGMICPRVALTADAAKRGDLSLYLDLKRAGGGEHNGNGLALCLPSITADALGEALDDIDVFVIDEASLVADLFSGDLVRKTRHLILEKLREKAKRSAVILLDADMTDKAADWWEQILLQDIDRYVIPERENVGRFVMDGWMATVGAIHSAEVPIWVASDSKRELKRIFEDLRAYKRRVLLITADTRGNPDVLAFMKNPNVEVTKYDAVLCSPSVDTGLSVTSPHIQMVFGIFCGVVTPQAMFQALRRVRPVTDLHVAWFGDAGVSVPWARLMMAGWRKLGFTVTEIDELVAARNEDQKIRVRTGREGLLSRARSAGFVVEARAYVLDPKWANARRKQKKSDDIRRWKEIAASAPLSDAEFETLRREPHRTTAQQHQCQRRITCRALRVEEVNWKQVRFVERHPRAALLFRLWRSRGDVVCYDDGMDLSPSQKRLDNELAALVGEFTDILGIDRETLIGWWSPETRDLAIDFLVANHAKFRACHFTVPGITWDKGRVVIKREELRTQSASVVKSVLELIGLASGQVGGKHVSRRKDFETKPQQDETQWCLATVPKPLGEDEFVILADPLDGWKHAPLFAGKTKVNVSPVALQRTLGITATTAKRMAKDIVTTAPDCLIRVTAFPGGPVTSLMLQ